jgi:hypothetical protein
MSTSKTYLNIGDSVSIITAVAGLSNWQGIITDKVSMPNPHDGYEIMINSFHGTFWYDAKQRKWFKCDDDQGQSISTSRNMIEVKVSKT